MENCIFCTKSLENGESTVTLGKKGCNNINKISSVRQDEISTVPGQRVHKDCRRDYICPNSARWKKEEAKIEPFSSIGSKDLRSTTQQFIFKENCLFCGQIAKNYKRKRGYDVVYVKTLEFQSSVEAACRKRNDKWGEQVFSRIQMAHSDLHAADAVYHAQCNSNFRTGKQMPQTITAVSEDNLKRRKTSFTGRPKNYAAENCFGTIMSRLEKERSQISIADLTREMEKICGAENAYSVVHMKKKIREYFGNSVVLTEEEGKPTVLTFRDNVSSILHDFYNRVGKENKDEEKKSIISTAAQLIKDDIKLLPSKDDYYPSAKEVESDTSNAEYVPRSLRMFLNSLFSEADSVKKVSAIGHAIIQSTRPRCLLAPLQIGLGIQMHHHFGSRFLVDTLCSLGFSSSYSEVQRFEMNAAATRSNESMKDNQSFIQFIADNVDHNIRSLDGYGTFHGMGIIAANTPGIKSDRVIPRLNPSISEINALAKINIKFYKEQSNEFRALKYEVLERREMLNDSWKIDLLSKACWPLKFNGSWSSIMSKTVGPYPGSSSITFLPMIDLNPSDESCIYTTLHFVCREALKNNCTPILTFDQPLYWKAMTIIQNEPSSSALKSVVLKLGGFHMEMSFVGSIGYLMSGSGLVNLLETVYASTAVSHMMSGKSIARAVRGHFLVDTALTAILLSIVYGIPVPKNETKSNEDTHDINDEADTFDSPAYVNDTCYPEEITDAISLLESFLKGNACLTDVNQSIALNLIRGKIDQFRQSRSKYRTANLWFQYMDMVGILRDFIKAERTGNWNLHLQSVRNMLPYLAASGHNMYVKSAWIYLHQMESLKENKPEIASLFEAGYHVIRRTDKYWAGISSDLAIEQALMRSIKTTGGLTRGRGMTESQRALWILSMPDCAEMNNAMQTFTGSNFYSSEQHKEDGISRQKRDTKDTLIFTSFLEERNPFVDEEGLRNIETGVSATSDVNAEKAREIGEGILASMNNRSVSDFSFKRKSQAITFHEKPTCLNFETENLSIDPQLLFQRFIVAADSIYEDKSEIFAYELASQPSSMFDSSGFMRSAPKSTLAEAIWNLGDCNAELKQDAYNYVIDGGSLIHKIPWKNGLTFGEICERYVNSVKLFGTDSTVVVFDGYISGPDTKDAMHLRRTKGIFGTRVTFSETTPFRSKKETFLANGENKQNFIEMLSKIMNLHGIETKHASADADVLIAKTAIQSSIGKPTILLGEDTDLLVLLLYFLESESNELIFKPNHEKKTKSKLWDINKTKRILGNEVCKVLPVIHAVSGCDTTSKLHGVGKGATMKKFIESQVLKDLGGVFLKESVKEDIINAGEQIISFLYGGVPLEGLDVLRYKKFANRVLTSKEVIQVHTLPPTTEAATYHSLRTYLQVQTWIEGKELNASDFGWFVANGRLMPIKTKKYPAPQRLLSIIHCKCKTNCETRRCTCKKHGLECNEACGECRGQSCSNCVRIDMETDTGEILSDT